MTDRKIIWLINQYASTPETGMGGRNYYLGKELAKRGYKVYLVAAGFSHLLREPPTLTKDFLIEEINEGFHFVWLKMPHYNGANDKKRIFNWFKFARKMLNLPYILAEKPDVILFGSPSLIPYVSALRLARKYKVRLIWDIRDLWPLTLIELAGKSKYHPLILLHQWVENLACRKSDYIVSNWPFAIHHLEKHGADQEKFAWIPNGFYPEEFNEQEALPDSIVQRLPVDKFIVGYTGTLGQANAIQTLLDTAKLTQADPNIHYVLVGSGRLEQAVHEFVQINELDNITLIGSIPKKQIPAMLSVFDVCYVGFVKSALYRYGSSLHKLPEYFMSGKHILYAIDSPFKPVDDAEAGITVPAEDPAAIVQGIYQLQALTPEQRHTMGENGRKAALEGYEYGMLARKLEAIMFGPI